METCGSLMEVGCPRTGLGHGVSGADENIEGRLPGQAAWGQAMQMSHGFSGICPFPPLSPSKSGRCGHRQIKFKSRLTT